jgi:hypothetical protein
MGELYALSPFKPIFIAKSVQGGGGFSSGHKWGILGGRQGGQLFKAKPLYQMMVRGNAKTATFARHVMNGF